MRAAGSIKIGGDFHGAGHHAHGASPPSCKAALAINADAITSGNGGNVAVWSDNYTNFAGNISARGGSSKAMAVSSKLPGMT